MHLQIRLLVFHFPHWPEVQRHQIVPNFCRLTQKLCSMETYHLSALLCRIQITAPHGPKLNREKIDNPKHRWWAEQTGGLSEINRILLFSAASALPSFSHFLHQPLAVCDYEWRPFHKWAQERKASLAGRAQTIDALPFIFSPLSLWSEQRHASTYSNSHPQFGKSSKFLVAHLTALMCIG